MATEAPDPGAASGPLAALVLLIEDEEQIRRFVRLALEHEGFQVAESATAARGAIDAGTRRPDLVILDLGLPDRDGVDLIRELRSWSNLPIIVLSARTSERAKIEALDAGADDFLVKPFGAGELLARVRAQLRRQAQAGGAGADALCVEFGEVRVDLGRRLAWRAGAVVHLTPLEFRLLATLLTRPERVLTHRQLLHAVWGPGQDENTHYVRVYMAQLRRKLEPDAQQPRHLITESGVGYRFAP